MRTRNLRVIVVGAGMAGIASVIRLRRAGITDITVYEKADEVGGTWRENTYPGIACDVPSHLYCYSFEPNPGWSHTFSPGEEIQAYLRDVTDRYDVRRATRFGQEVTSLSFDDGQWHLTTSTGERDQADVVLAATGVLHHPHVPDLPGLDTFAGAAFHSARWDHGVAIDGRRIGILGTGSSAVQITSAVVDRVARLSLFQRTPQWIMPIANVAYTDEEQRLFGEDPATARALRDGLERAFTENFANAVVDAESPQMKLIEDLCRANLEDNVRDPELRERLRPSYRAACKRLIASADFYDAIQRPNAELVTDPVERVEPDGIRTADGRLHPLDVLVLATGFRVDRFLRPIEVTGRGGVRLDAVWAQRPSAHLALTVPGFPNLFLLNGPNGPVGNFSLIEVAELQLDYVLQLLELLGDGSCAEVEVTNEAATAFEEARVAAAGRTIWVTGCRSWYLDDRGVPSAWPWTFDRFREEMARPDLAAFRLTPAVAGAPR